MSTETLNPNNTYGVYVSMLMLFRSGDLQTLLGSFDLDTSGSKSQLQNQAIALLKNTPRSFYQTYSLKIIDMFKSLYCFVDNDVTQNETQYQNQQQTLSVAQAQLLMPVNTQDQQQQQQLLQQQQQQLLLLQQQQQQQQQQQLLQQQIMPMNMQGQQQMSGSLWYDQQYVASAQQALLQEPTYGFNAGWNNNFQSVDPSNMNYYQSMYGRHANTVSHNQQLNALTPSNHTVTTDDNVQHTAINFTFKKIPFYDIIDEVIKPTVLTVQDASLFLKTVVSRDLKSNMFKLQLSMEQSSKITMSSTFLNGNIEYTYQLQMRIGRLQANSIEITDSLPTRFFIQTNDKINGLPEYDHQRSNPIDCTRLFKLDLNAVNEMAIHWDQDSNTYVMGMYLVHRLSSNTLLNKLFTKRSKSAVDTLNFIIDKMAVFDPDVHSPTLYRFSLICPLSKIRIKVPVNSINCNHLQCFDAYTFILMNEKTPTWKCPCCNSPCLYDDMQINFYFLNILTDSYLPEFVEEIELLQDGTWRVCNARRMINIENVSRTNQIPFVDNGSLDGVIDLTIQDKEINVRQSGQN